MQTRIGAALAALLFGAPASAEPVTLSCKYLSGDALYRGKLALTVDLEARRVRILPLFAPGIVIEYADGAVAPIYLSRGHFDVVTEPVAQFVTVKPDQVEVAFRYWNGELGHWAYFNRSALGKPGKPCHWRGFEDFAVS